MKLKLSLLPIVAAAGTLAYVALHPGVAYAEPRIASTPPTEIRQMATYTLDEMHADVSFEIMHLGLSRTRGRFN